MDLRLNALRERFDDVEEPEFFVGTKHIVNSVDGRDLLGTKLREATCDDYAGVRIGSKCPSDDFSAGTVGLLSDGTRIQDNDVGGFAKRHNIVARSTKFVGYRARFGEIEFTAEGMERDGRHGFRREKASRET